MYGRVNRNKRNFIKLLSIKKIIVFLISILFSFALNAQVIIGAWENTSVSENGDQLKRVVIFAEGYQVLTTYDAITSKFIHTNGGTWNLEGNIMTEKIEFDTDNPELVGTEVSFKVRVTNNEIEIVDGNLKFKRLENGLPGKLQGAWLMSGRIRNGVTQLQDTNRPRKTMKILSGTRFQWIAYNTETKQFMGSDGGTYTTKDGTYN